MVKFTDCKPAYGSMSLEELKKRREELRKDLSTVSYHIRMKASAKHKFGGSVQQTQN